MTYQVRSGPAPAACGATTCDASSISAAEGDPGVEHRGNNGNALRAVQDLARNFLIGSLHDLFQNLGGRLRALDDCVRLTMFGTARSIPRRTTVIFVDFSYVGGMSVCRPAL